MNNLHNKPQITTMPDIQQEKFQKIIAEYRAAGINWSDWARRHGFKVQTVKDVVNQRTKCVRGEAFEVAVALGLRPKPPPHLENLSGFKTTNPTHL